jgi:hypothetical protein
MQFSWDKEMGMHIYIGEKPREEKRNAKKKSWLLLPMRYLASQKHLTYIDRAIEYSRQWT